ncbi:hypothetical protein [Bacillus xiapuensis]|uniref:Uncharacterized protein n=1 Tax=Bacillus xiapuensis TaxID=2014075 RepID=A0ABU6N839_9BACI|nr:hypothetical protein [Bacillus xiapuensis]
MGYAKEEQETTLVYSAEDNEWSGYSCYSPHITKIVKLLGIENIDAEYEDGRESPLSIKFKLKSNQVSFRQGNKREMSEEQKQKAAERLAKARENK